MRIGFKFSSLPSHTHTRSFVRLALFFSRNFVIGYVAIAKGQWWPSRAFLVSIVSGCFIMGLVELLYASSFWFSHSLVYIPDNDTSSPFLMVYS